MKLTTAENIERRLRTGYDPDYHNRLYAMANYAFGDVSMKDRSASGGGLFPDYADTVPKLDRSGRSKRMLDVAMIALARMGYAEPQPEFPQVDKYTAEVRKQYWLERYRSHAWCDHTAYALLEGDQFGAGFCKVGLVTNPETGKQRVDIQHVPAVNMLWDRHYRHPASARWFCCLNYVPVEDAEDMWGRAAVKDYVRNMFDENVREPIQAVRIFEYWDMGWGTKGHPTMAIIPGDLDQKPIEITENDFGILPLAAAAGYFMPGMQRPTGKIYSEMPLNEEMNRLDSRMQGDVDRGKPATLLDAGQVDPKDLKDYMMGKGPGIIRRSKPNPAIPVIERTPPALLDPNLMEWRRELKDQWNEASGTSELDRGNFSESRRTLGENELLVSRSSGKGTWQMRQAIQFYIRLVDVVLQVAKIGDTDPIMLDIFGSNVPMNVRGRPESSMKHWLVEPSRVVIGDDSLTVTDQYAEKARKMAALQPLAPYVGVLVDPEWYVEELLRAAGVQDPTEAMIRQAQPPMGAPTGGMPPSPMPQPVAQPAHLRGGPGLAGTQQPRQMSPY